MEALRVVGPDVAEPAGRVEHTRESFVAAFFAASVGIADQEGDPLTRALLYDIFESGGVIASDWFAGVSEQKKWPRITRAIHIPDRLESSFHEESLSGYLSMVKRMFDAADEARRLGGAALLAGPLGEIP